MPVFASWLGLCHLRQVANDCLTPLPTLVAAWANDVEGFERKAHFHTNTHGLQMILAENVMPVDDWLSEHSGRRDGQLLAGMVSVTRTASC